MDNTNKIKEIVTSVESEVIEQTCDNQNKTRSIAEGSAEILTKGNVFYNPVQQFNRDLSLSVITAFSQMFQKELEQKLNVKQTITNSGDNCSKSEVKDVMTAFVDMKPGVIYENGLVILEALSATGLRSIRYAKEIPGIKQIIANDLSNVAVESIKMNIKHNNVEHLIKSNYSDAMTLMYMSTMPDARYNVIDLDPYGSPTKFLDGAVQSVSDGGLLLVTATDMAVLAGNTPESCFAKYGTIPLKTKSCHEMAIRILLKCIESHANCYGRYIEPLLSISADFYVRVFVRVFTSPLACKKSSSKQSMVYQCIGCDSITFQPLCIIKQSKPEQNTKQLKFKLPTGPFVNTNCEHCGHQHHMGGPIWTAPIHDPNFIKMLLETINKEPYNNLVTHSRMFGMLSVIEEELHDVPLYYAIDKMCSILKLEVVPILKFRSALLHANYRVSFSHAYKSSIKTDAPTSVLWDILRCWSKLHPVKMHRFIEGSTLKAILSKEPAYEYNLNDIHALANPESRKNSLSRFPENPAAYWGPGTRATIMVGDNKMLKSIRNQNKRKHDRITDSLSTAEKIHKNNKL